MKDFGLYSDFLNKQKGDILFTGINKGNPINFIEFCALIIECSLVEFPWEKNISIGAERYATPKIIIPAEGIIKE